MITVISEHSIDLDLLPQLPLQASILDLGCRGFLFTNDMESRGCFVVSLDIDKLDTDKPYFQIAISDYDGTAGIQYSSDPQATRIKEGKEIPCYTLESFSSAVGIDMWDCIKMDIEGEEYKIIMSLKRAPAKQISFECHCHTGIYGFKEVDEMVKKLESLGYELVSHKLSSQHGAGQNFWDSLAILK